MIFMRLIAPLLFLSTVTFAQLTIDKAREVHNSNHLGTYSYHEAFIGHAGYGSPTILTSDGGAALFGDGDPVNEKAAAHLVKLDKDGKELWRSYVFNKYDEMESQSVAQDSKGNYYVFMLVYSEKGYRGGAQRVVMFNKSGKLVWDKLMGTFTLLNRPTFSYIRSEPNGKIYLRGHIVKNAPPAGKDPDSRYFEGWLDDSGKLTQRSGDVIDWKNDEWQKKFKPD